MVSQIFGMSFYAIQRDDTEEEQVVAAAFFVSLSTPFCSVCLPFAVQDYPYYSHIFFVISSLCILYCHIFYIPLMDFTK